MFGSKSIRVLSGLVRSNAPILKATQAGQIQRVSITGTFIQRSHQTKAPTAAKRGFATQAVAVEKIQDCQRNSDLLEVKFSNERVVLYPKIWMRMHCQCSDCYDEFSTARALPMDDWQMSDCIEHYQVTQEGGLKVTWSNGHHSEFKPDFLLTNTFEDAERAERRNEHSLPKHLWSSDHKVKEFNYPDLMKDDKHRLEWLRELEITGACLVKNCPRTQGDGPALAERVGLVKRTFFGEVSNVVTIDSPNNLAYSNAALDLHNDLAYNDELPGIIFLNMVQAHPGKGGESTISDGIYAAELMRKDHPKEFEILANTDVFYTCAGIDRNSNDKNAYEYDRVNKGPIINLYNDGVIKEIRLSNHALNSFLDMPADKVTGFVNAYKIYNTLIKENSVSFKLKSGEMLTMDNTRCQHGRTEIVGDGSRHLATSYMTMDEARCRRRVLQQKLNC